jgi:CheY-like chemotaxis protein
LSPVLKFPQTDGGELTKRLRVAPHLRNVIAAVLTGHAAEAERVRAARFDVHVLKPVDPATLTERIKQLKRLKPACGCEP